MHYFSLWSLSGLFVTQIYYNRCIHNMCHLLFVSFVAYQLNLTNISLSKRVKCSDLQNLITLSPRRTFLVRCDWERHEGSWLNHFVMLEKGRKEKAEYFPSDWLDLFQVKTTQQPKPFTPDSSHKNKKAKKCSLRFSPSFVPSNVSNENKLSGGSFILRIACQLLCHLFFPFSSFSSLPDPSVTVYCLLVCLLGLPFTFLSHLPSSFPSKTVHSGITFPFLSRSIVSSFLASHPSLITECQALEATQWRE